MIRPNRKPSGRPPTNTPVSVDVVYKCGHKRKAKDFCKENCADCRAKRRQEKQNRNGARKPAKIALAAFRFPDGTEFNAMRFRSGNWAAILRVPLNDGVGANFEVVAPSFEKLGMAAKDAWLAYCKKNARPPLPK